MSVRRDPTAKYFKCSDRERAVFEVGVKLGSLFHQYMGAPYDRRSVRTLERAIQETVEAQPLVESARVRIDRASLRHTPGPYGYTSLLPEHLEASVMVRCGDARARGRLKFLRGLNYPLMWVDHLEG